mmetsp:Transcript_8923/g.25617  ORF Transcript_8923/g.25617 Transcript_8923/m.25617 type:complete len:244 (+) Transcript_8923:518-1249(+)
MPRRPGRNQGDSSTTASACWPFAWGRTVAVWIWTNSPSAIGKWPRLSTARYSVERSNWSPSTSKPANARLACSFESGGTKVLVQSMKVPITAGSSSMTRKASAGDEYLASRQSWKSFHVIVPSAAPGAISLVVLVDVVVVTVLVVVVTVVTVVVVSVVVVTVEVVRYSPDSNPPMNSSRCRRSSLFRSKPAKANVASATVIFVFKVSTALRTKASRLMGESSSAASRLEGSASISAKASASVA